MAKKSIAVIGLGRFGEAVARRLSELGHDVIGIDRDAEVVQQLAPDLAHVIQAEANRKETLEALGVGEVDCAVVGIGDDLEGSILAVLALAELGIKDIHAKAVSRRHGAILQRLGVKQIIYPEVDMGTALADRLAGG